MKEMCIRKSENPWIHLTGVMSLRKNKRKSIAQEIRLKGWGGFLNASVGKSLDRLRWRENRESTGSKRRGTGRHPIRMGAETPRQKERWKSEPRICAEIQVKIEPDGLWNEDIAATESSSRKELPICNFVEGPKVKTQRIIARTVRWGTSSKNQKE